MKEKLPVRRSSVEVGPTPAMELPEGWFVEEKPRPNSSSRPGRIDKIYVESSTGKTFRSMPAVEQYLEGKVSIVSSPKRPRRTPEKKPNMQITPFTPRSSDFVLPDGWIVEANRRSNSDTVDKYYIEAETGKKFRSLLAVKRHLSEAGHEYASDNEPKTRRKSSFAVAVKGDKNEASVSAVESRTPHSTYCSANFVLPDDWAVEKHTREKSHVIDKYYIEPETGRRFRSLVSVERHLNQKEDNELEMRLRDFKCPKKRRSPSSRSSSKSTTASEETSCQEVPDDLLEKSEENPTTPKEVSPDNDSGPLEQYSTPEKTETVEETEGPKDDFGSPPSSVNWVLTGPAGDMWNPQLDELVVPESTKQKWSEKFISTLNQEDK